MYFSFSTHFSRIFRIISDTNNWIYQPQQSSDTSYNVIMTRKMSVVILSHNRWSFLNDSKLFSILVSYVSLHQIYKFVPGRYRAAWIRAFREPTSVTDELGRGSRSETRLLRTNTRVPGRIFCQKPPRWRNLPWTVRPTATLSTLSRRDGNFNRRLKTMGIGIVWIKCSTLESPTISKNEISVRNVQTKRIFAVLTF